MMISLYKTKNINHTGKKRFPPFSLRKPFCLALTLSLLLGGGGCSGKQTTTEQNTPPPLPTQQETAESFSVFLDDFFSEYVTSDSLSLHYTLLDPEAFQIEKPAVSFGKFSVDSLQASNRTATEYLTRLHAFSKESLQPEEQLTYELLEYALKYSAIPEGTELYDSPLGPTTGLQTQLPVLLAEYRFSSLEDVEDYFLLLEDMPRYFHQLCTFEQARSAAGTQSCAEVLSRILLQCKSFVEDPEHNFLIESFRDRLASLPDISAQEIATLCIRNQKLVFTKVIPAYEQLIDTLQKLTDTSVPAVGLAARPNGSDYYEYLVQSNTGSSRSIRDIEAMLQDALLQNMVTMVSLYQSEALQAELKDISFSEATSPEEILNDLQEQIQKDFPVPADAAFRVETVHPSLEDFISPALYLIPPFDNYKENVIYINPAKCAPESLFSTLAHEGYPGHLYQNTFFAATAPHPARILLNFTGYDEGWGTYAELYSYRYADCSEELKQFLIAEQVAGLCLYSLADLHIHYHGKSMDTVIAFLTEHGLSPEGAEEVYYTLLAEPAVYLPYSVGYLEFCSLRDLYRSYEGDEASLLPFHTFLLETGPAPFAILEQRLSANFR
ncbi:MAG: DUF885 domain-containing protein [Lachnospiraceae bacterium]|nr:DUF885 domain-containing protein [Lachnospiraceae bacterium]